MQTNRKLVSLVLIVTTLSLAFNVIVIFRLNNCDQQRVNCEPNRDQCHCDNKLEIKMPEVVKSLNRVKRFQAEYWSFLSSLAIYDRRPNRTEMLEILVDMNNVLNAELEGLYSHFDSWIEKRLKFLSDKMRDKIDRLQNPTASQCASADKMYAYYSNVGLGAQIYFIAEYFIKAYFLDSMVVIDQLFTNYLKRSPLQWDHYLSPISESCQPNASVKFALNSPENRDKRDLPNNMIGRQIAALHPEPKVFWWSQFTAYALRPNKVVKQIIDDSVIQCGFTHPIVGVHIRRGDKIGSEAIYHSVDEYMFHANHYFARLSLNGYSGAKRVFVATDDDSAVDEIRRLYTDFEIIEKSCFAISEPYDSRPQRPDDYANLMHTLVDMHLLSMTDYIVCAMSSTFCRTSYQLLVARKPLTAFGYHSLDVPWFPFFYLNYMRRQFRHKHSAIAINGQRLSFNAGDDVTLAAEWCSLATSGERRDGFAWCLRSQSRVRSKFRCPLYKTDENILFTDHLVT